MQKIFKYELNGVDRQVVEMPAGAIVLSVANHRGNICLWAKVDTERPYSRRVFDIIGTGNPIADASRQFLGSVVIDPFVWHVFELIE